MSQKTKPEANVGDCYTRERPNFPRVGVGLLVLRGDQFILVKRGNPPARGKWSLPGGLVHLGETIIQAAERELKEECNISAQLRNGVKVFEYIQSENNTVLYHYIILEFIADYLGGEIRAGSDALDAAWFRMDDLAQMDTTDGLSEFIKNSLQTS